MNKFFKRVAIGAAIAATYATVPAVASAQSVFNFANLAHNGTSYVGFLPTDGVPCTFPDQCSSNVDGGIYGDDLTFVSGGITVKAEGYLGSAQVAVVQDSDSIYNNLTTLFGSTAKGAGLGVYSVVPRLYSDDNITTNEILKLSFSTLVELDKVGLRAEGHNTTGWTTGATFQYSTDGATWLSSVLPLGTGLFTGLDGVSGTDFWFRFGGAAPDQFYVSSVTVTAVPEPETYAMLMAGLGLMGVVARRRKQ